MGGAKLMNIDLEKIEKLAVEQVVSEILRGSDFDAVVEGILRKKIDVIFAEKAEAAISASIDCAIKDGFGREYQKTDSFGRPIGDKTTIGKELEKLIGSYWQQRVHKSTGQPSSDSYNSVPRAEFLMTQICANDFSEMMKGAAVTATAKLKDGLRAEIAGQMNRLLDSLFHVRSLQDQGKEPMPWNQLPT